MCVCDVSFSVSPLCVPSQAHTPRKRDGFSEPKHAPIYHHTDSSHPDAKPPIPENPYISYRNPWRWDLRTQLFLSSANILADDPATSGRSVNEIVLTTLWQPREIELVYPVARQGGFYWSPDRDIEASIRLDDAEFCSVYIDYPGLGASYPGAPVAIADLPIKQKFVPGTDAEYSYWQSGDIKGKYRQLQLIHLSHIVCADTVFNDKLARQLPWPDEWAPGAAGYLTPIVDSVGEPVPESAAAAIDNLVQGWIGEGNKPRDAPQLDVVKFLTGKVIEYFTVSGQSTQLTQRTLGAGRPLSVVTANAWGGFLVRPANLIVGNPRGSRNDLAVLLTSVLRSAGVPARTVICIDQEIEDPLLNTVSLVEFAMHDPERDITFWVPIDIDRVRLTSAGSSQYKRAWLYFGTNDHLHHIIPMAYYFHPPARYRAYDLPLLYGIRSTSDDSSLPDYMIQSLLVDPMVTPMTAHPRRRDK